MRTDAKKGLIAVALLLLIIISLNFMPRIGAYGKSTVNAGEYMDMGEQTAGFCNDGTGASGIAGFEDDIFAVYDDIVNYGDTASCCDDSAVFTGVATVKNEKKAEETQPARYNAKSALLMDYGTGEVLQSQNPDERRPIASMVKIMTLILVFEEIDKGNLNIEQQIAISENAASMGGSQAFLQSGAAYGAGELIKSIVVASANDSCVAMAEHIAGSVESFVGRMNEKATALKLANTYFVNCTGLPAPNQYSTATDVAVMFKELISHKQFFEYAKIWMYDFAHPGGRVTGLTNTNKLVRFYNGCDGGKTGFTSEALSCLAATAKRGDTRLISVIIAAPSSKERNAEVGKMLNYGFANYETRQLVFKGLKTDIEAKVENGKQETVAVAPEKDYFYLLKKGEKAEFTYSIELNTVKAPAAEGDCAGEVKILLNNKEIGEVNLILMSKVEKASYLDMLNKVIKNW